MVAISPAGVLIQPTILAELYRALCMSPASGGLLKKTAPRLRRKESSLGLSSFLQVRVVPPLQTTEVSLRFMSTVLEVEDDGQ